jgi:riboflavin synthase
MFTGLIEEVGTIESVEERGPGRRFRVRASAVLSDTKVGDSLAIDGCCLTLVECHAQAFAVEAVPETLARTTLGERRAGDPVNLERALRLDQRLGGHLVQGHVDGVGVVRSVAREGDGARIGIGLPEGLERFVAGKGSLAVDGVSLTVARELGDGCEIALIPHTLDHTTAGSYRPGRRVNLEVDLLARYLARLLDERAASRRTS